MKRFCLLLAFLSVWAEGWTQSAVKVSGVVRDHYSGKPLVGANVVIQGTGLGTSTDQSGHFQFENLLTGEYAIKASYMGYSTETKQNVRVRRGQPVQLQFDLRPRVIQLQKIEVSAKRFQKHPTADMVVITRKDIDRAHAQSLSELLQQVPGVHIQNNGGVNGKKTISIRGSQTNQVLVLLDGIPLNDQLIGETDLSGIPLNIIEKIEIYKGGSSPQFGNGALGGVLNIRSRNRFTNRFRISGTGGSFRFRKVQPGWSGSYHNLDYFFSYQYIRNEGNFPYHYQTPDHKTINTKRTNADLLSRTYFGRLSYHWGGHRISLKAHRKTSDRGLPGKIHAWTAYARVNTIRNLWGAEYSYTTGELTFSLNYSHSQTHTENSNLWPSDAALRYRRYPRYHYEDEVKIHQITSSVQYQPVDGLFVTLGYDGRMLRFGETDLMRGEPTPLEKANDRSNGFFLQQEWKQSLPFLSSHMIITPGVRYDEITIDDGRRQRHERQWSPGIGFLFSAGDKHQAYVKSNIARSFRVPTFADLFYQDFRMRGKPDLLPEKGLNMDISLGGRLRFLGELHGEWTAFKNTIDDLIVWRLGSFETFSPFNTDAEITGQEVSLEWESPREWLHVNAGYTAIRPLNKSHQRTTHNKILPYRPRNSVKAGIRFKQENWGGSLKYRHIGRRFVTESNTIEMPPYQVVDAHVSYSFSLYDVEIVNKLSVLNFTDQDYEIIENMPLPPREYRFSLILKIK